MANGLFLKRLKSYKHEELYKLCEKYKNLFLYLDSNNKSKEILYYYVEDLLKRRRNVVKGGRSDSITLEDYIDRYIDVKDLDILWEFNKGVEIEYEHTNDYWTSLDIACDHIYEFPDYYTRLVEMEEEGERYWEGKI